ncbi:sensor histidine kinase, partial [Morganella morganii]|uniref:sensor histidine kinase n=1 Tax=Morganella morganii TaxID=582 RepID=UPI0022304A33
SIQLLGTALARHRVVVDLPPDLPLVQLDAVLMERVFGNLLDNASKYAPPDTDVRIALAVEADQLQVRVRNAGTGFPPERLQEVFEPFARGEPEGHVPGMGLGLAICKVIVEAHGGRIEALNPP